MTDSLPGRSLLCFKDILAQSIAKDKTCQTEACYSYEVHDAHWLSPPLIDSLKLHCELFSEGHSALHRESQPSTVMVTPRAGLYHMLHELETENTGKPISSYIYYVIDLTTIRDASYAAIMQRSSLRRRPSLGKDGGDLTSPDFPRPTFGPFEGARRGRV